MAIEIGALRAMLSLDSAAFERGAKRAEASMSNLQRRFSRVGRSLRSFGTSMSTRVTAPMVAGFGLMARSAFNSAFEIERMAQLSNAGLVEFQRFAAGARDVGVEQDKLSDILKDTNDRIGDFIATGGGPMADFFENIAPKVGVTAEQFQRLSGPEALQLYVSSLEKAGLSQQQMTFYMEALASDATLLLPLLRDNGAEMDRLADSAENVGAIMDAKTIAALLRSRESLRAAGDAVQGLSWRIVAALAPTLELISEKVESISAAFAALPSWLQRVIANFTLLAGALGPAALAVGVLIKVLGGLRVALVSTGIGALVVGAGVLAAMMAELTRATGSFGEAFALVKDVASEVFKRIGELGEIVKIRLTSKFLSIKATFFGVLSDMVGAMPDWANKVVGVFVGVKDAAVAAWDVLPDALANIGARAVNVLIEKVAKGVQNLVTGPMAPLLRLAGINPAALGLGAEAIAGLMVTVPEAPEQGLGGAASSAFSNAMNQDYFGDISGDLGALSEALQSDAELINNVASLLAEQMKRPLESVQAIRDAMAEVAEETGLTTEEVERIAATLDGIGDGDQGGSAGRAARGLDDVADSVEGLGEKSSQAADRFGDLVAGLITGSQKIGDVLSRLGQQLLSSGISGLASSLAPNLFSEGGFFAGLFDKGGLIPAGQWGIAGERGPEIVTGPARVTSRRKTADMLSGGGRVSGTATVRIVAPPGFTAEQRGEAHGIAVEVMENGLESYDRHVLPDRVQDIGNDPARRG